ncbi:MAG: hypothetical protein C4575_07765 [Desulforudis sp.]|jgi:hypothetical protein|nr:hypothetical protein [Clostridia bacterium]MDQ7792458.1 hypothetical protein [Clostridia bacterium]RJX19922.1 MAG: hypothetical protein C4575_07765 [Desulforudis sp.]
MANGFWYSLTPRQQELLLSMHKQLYPLHAQKIEERISIAQSPEITDEDLRTLRQMGLVYATGPFWNLTKEGQQLLEYRYNR